MDENKELISLNRDSKATTSLQPPQEGIEQSGKKETAFIKHVNAKGILNNTVSSDLQILKEAITPVSQPKETTLLPKEAQSNLSDTLERLNRVIHDQSTKGEQSLEIARQNLATTDLSAIELHAGMQSVRGQITDIATQIVPVEQQLKRVLDELKIYGQRNIAARVLSHKAIEELKAQAKALERQKEALQHQESQHEAQITEAEKAFQLMEQTRGEAVVKIAEEIVSGISQRYSIFRDSLLGDPEVKRELNERFMQAELMPALAEIRKGHDIPQDKVDEYIELIRGQLNEGTTIRDDDPSEKKDRISKRNQRIEEIYKEPNYGFSLSSLVYKLGLYTPSANFRQGNEGYDQIIELLVRNEEYELLQSLAEEIKQSSAGTKISEVITSIINSHLVPNKEEHGRLSKRGNQESEKPNTLDIMQIDDDTFSKHFMDQVALQRWTTVRDYPGTTALFSPEGFSHLEARVQKKTINALCVTLEHTDKAADLGYRLLLFKNAEVAPIVIMNCWREPGESGEMPFLSSNTSVRSTEAYRYIASLPESEVEKLRQMNIPGVMEIINTVKENPDSFLTYQIDSPDFDRFVKTYADKFGLSERNVRDEINNRFSDTFFADRVNQVLQEIGLDDSILDYDNYRIPNPPHQAIERGLGKLCVHFIEKGNGSEQFFVMSLLKRYTVELEKRGYELLGSLLKNTKNQTLQKEMLEMVLRRSEDVDAALMVINSYPDLPPEIQKEVKEAGPQLFRRFFRQVEAIEPETSQLFGTILGINNNDFLQTVNFIRGLPPHDSIGTDYETEKFNLYVEAAKQPDILPFTQELATFGYRFNIDHVHVLQEMLKNRSSILAAIKELQGDFPGFRYNLPYEFKVDVLNGGVEQFFITNRYEVFVRQFSSNSFLDLFDKLHNLQLKQGSFNQEFSNGVFRTLRWRDYLVKLEAKETIDDSKYLLFHTALQKLISGISNQGSLSSFRDFYLNLNTLNFLARQPESAEIFFGFPEHGRLLMGKNMEKTLQFVYQNEDLLLKDMADLDFLNNFVERFGANTDFFLTQYTEGIRKRENPKERGQFTETILGFPDHGKLLMKKDMSETLSFIFKNEGLLLQDSSDIKFLNNLVGEFGKKADQLIRGYLECLKAEAASTADKELVLEFAHSFRVISPITFKGYKEAKEAGHEKVYVAQLQSLAERMTGSGVITDEERKRPYYKDLLRHVYSNNSGNWGSLERGERCPDRNTDLAEFKIEPRYEIDLLSQSQIRIKEGEKLDMEVKAEVQKPILEEAERIKALGHDKEKMQAALQENVDQTLQAIMEKGGLKGIDLTSVTTLDEKLFLIMTDSLYGSRSIDTETIKRLIITYEFTTFEDISDYIAGTSDRVGRASNQDYALLCEVNAFYSDRIKEVNRRLVQAAWNNPSIASKMPEYFSRLAQDTTIEQRKNMINKLQVERLGLSDGFLRQVGKILEKRNGRKYSIDEVGKIVQKYEGLAGGLTEKTSISANKETKAFYGQLRSQRERTFEALKVITGQEVNPKQVHLGEIDLQQALATEAIIREGKYDEEQFASYTVQRFIDFFEAERVKINTELAKFESLTGKQREVLYGFITKSKESAHAVGGVCVAGDNPSNHPNNNIWGMPNYFQMVFQEPDTLQCQGLVLLHSFSQSGKKVLTASYNPSSTYLYSVDEAALFNGITSSLEQFATENGFDIIVVSNNKAIRTNRTGGEFEKTMDKRVATVNKTFKFDSPQQFSFNPNYKLQEMDIIWEKK